MQLAGQKIVITGGARGIGASTARAYVAEGASVALLDVLDEEGADLAAELSQDHPGKALFQHCDVADRQSVEDAFARVALDLGGAIDVLAHVAGIERSSPAEDIDEAALSLILQVNLSGTVFCNQAAFGLMKAGGGRIINFGSGAGLNPYPGGAHYAATKAGVMAWTRTVANEWAKYGIRVNSVAPAIWTPMYDEHRARLSVEELREHDLLRKKQVPLGGRLGDPDTDLAPVMVFLASEGATFITGQVIAVNGGLFTVR